jgi:hypothetical protein
MGKDRFDGLMQIANFRRQVREDRQKISWTVTLGLWGASAPPPWAYGATDKLLSPEPSGVICRAGAPRQRS